MIFFFKQKTAYVMRSSNWSADVCTSDLAARRRPEIDLEGQGVAPRLAVEDPRERRIRDHAAVPVVLAVDLHGGKAGRQGAGGHEVFRSQPALGGVEVDEVAAAHVHCADADPHIAGVEAVEVRSEEHTSELQSLMRISYAVFCLKKKKYN